MCVYEGISFGYYGPCDLRSYFPDNDNGNLLSFSLLRVLVGWRPVVAKRQNSGLGTGVVGKKIYRRFQVHYSPCLRKSFTSWILVRLLWQVVFWYPVSENSVCLDVSLGLRWCRSTLGVLFRVVRLGVKGVEFSHELWCSRDPPTCLALCGESLVCVLCVLLPTVVPLHTGEVSGRGLGSPDVCGGRGSRVVGPLGRVSSGRLKLFGRFTEPKDKNVSERVTEF